MDGEHVEPGVTTDQLDAIGHEFLLDHGAYPSTLGYRGFSKSLCTSVNEVICHGIPDDRALLDGDIINIDVKKRRLDMEVPATEIKKRLASWKAPKPRYTTGVFAKYVALVANASEGAVTS